MIYVMMNNSDYRHIKLKGTEEAAAGLTNEFFRYSGEWG
jgi:hypothetical protein